MTRGVLFVVLLVLLCSASVANATTYYVRTDGNNANTGTANTSGGAWRTIAKGCQTAVAGDTVRVQAGTYAETASGCTSGASGTGNTVTLVADGAVTTCGLSFAGKSYIRIIGFTMDPSAGSCGGSPSTAITGTGTNTGLEFWNNTVTNTSSHGIIFDFPGTGGRCDKCIIFSGTVSNIGDPTAAHGIILEGNDTFVSYVTVDVVCYVGIRPAGSRSRYLNNNFSGFAQCGGIHPDFYYAHANSTLGYSNGVIEANFMTGTPTANDNKLYHIQNEGSTDWNDDVFRFNAVYNTGSAASHSIYISSTGSINRWRQYNNTSVLGDRAAPGTQCGGGNDTGAGSATVYFFNNIYDQCWGDASSSSIDPFGSNIAPASADYNLARSPLGTMSFVAQWTNQAHERSNVDPGYVDRANQNYSLSSGGAARGVGGPLTTASGSGSNSTSLTVAANTGSFFIGSNASNVPQYGGNLVPGDFITVGSCTAQVSSVSGDVLTLASGCTWANADPVYFGSSSTVDIGAYPYKSGGYTLTATYSVAGGTATIAPNDSGLVRLVVCYNDNVPYAIANAAPFTCTTPAGTFSAVVYPRYASQTQSVTAVAASGGAGKPRVQIRDAAFH